MTSDRSSLFVENDHVGALVSDLRAARERIAEYEEDNQWYHAKIANMKSNLTHAREVVVASRAVEEAIAMLFSIYGNKHAGPILDEPVTVLKLALDTYDQENVPDLCADKEREAGYTGSETLESDVAGVLNRYSAENASDTPDFILTKYLLGCLTAFNAATHLREAWYGRSAIASASTCPICEKPSTPIMPCASTSPEVRHD